MKVSINENVNKSLKWITISFIYETKELCKSFKCEGKFCENNFEKIISKYSIEIASAKQLNYNIKNQGLEYLGCVN